LKLDGEELFISDHYNGKIPWLVQPSYKTSAPISLPRVIMKKRFRDNPGTYVDFIAENINKKLNLDIRLEYASEAGEKRTNRSVKYHYNFDKREWVLDVDA
jgi:hypothetical protein